ncbi:MAG: trehalose-6-phosphate synthase [Pseudomonadota bacterium]
MSSSGKLIAVSNRVAIPKAGSPAAGGLAVGVQAALADQGGLWFGWNGKLSRTEASDADVVSVDGVDYATISLNERDFEQYYNGYSNRVLWPICHYLNSFIQFEAEDFEGYLRVNTVFARKLAPLIGPNDMLWVHDYHLIPLAAELRAAGYRNPIGFFLHVPFPSYEAFRAIPGHDYLLRAMCAYDVVGFQTERDLAAFRTCMRQPEIGGQIVSNTRIDVAGGTMHADAFPIGIDVEGLQAAAEVSADSEPVQRMVRSLSGRDLIIGVDRLDYSKALTQRFMSYERLLQKYPNCQSSLVYMQIAPPTRTGVRAYDEIRNELEQQAGRINGRFAEADWVPIRYLNKGIERNQLMGFLRVATSALVTPVRDGMNLVAKEFVAAQDPADPGIPVVSSLAGASRELTEAVIVNPYDKDNVADGIASVITMDRDERRERYEAMIKTLKKNDITAWRRRFVDALRDCNRA